VTDLHAIASFVQSKLKDLLDKPTSAWPKEIQDTLKTDHLGPRVMEQQELRLRLSHGIACGRRQWYLHNEPQKQTNQSPGLVQLCKFSIGDLWEAYAHALLPHCMPDGWTYHDTDDHEVAIDDVTGHLDGVMVHKNGDVIIVDAKHTSEFRIKKWANGMPDWEWGYRAQATNYMWAVQGAIARREWPFGGSRVIGFLWPASYSQKFGLWDVAVGWAYESDQELKSYGKQVLRQYHDARTKTNPPQRWSESNICRYCDFRDYCKGDLR